MESCCRPQPGLQSRLSSGSRRRSQRLGHNFQFGELLDALGFELVQQLIQDRTIALAYFLKLYTHAQILGDVLHLSLEGDADIENIE